MMMKGIHVSFRSTRQKGITSVDMHIEYRYTEKMHAPHECVHNSGMPKNVVLFV